MGLHASHHHCDHKTETQRVVSHNPVIVEEIMTPCKGGALLFYILWHNRASDLNGELSRPELACRCIEHAITTPYGIKCRVDREMYEAALVMES
jgi:hypothetical protein